MVSNSGFLRMHVGARFLDASLVGMQFSAISSNSFLRERLSARLLDATLLRIKLKVKPSSFFSKRTGAERNGGSTCIGLPPDSTTVTRA